MIWLYILCFGVGALVGSTLMALMVMAGKTDDEDEKRRSKELEDSE